MDYSFSSIFLSFYRSSPQYRNSIQFGEITNTKYKDVAADELIKKIVEVAKHPRIQTELEKFQPNLKRVRLEEPPLASRQEFKKMFEKIYQISGMEPLNKEICNTETPDLGIHGLGMSSVNQDTFELASIPDYAIRLFAAPDSLSFNETIFLNNLFRPYQANLVRKTAASIGLNTLIPKSYILKIEDRPDPSLPYENRFCVISEKALSTSTNLIDTVANISALPYAMQHELADKLATLILETGLSNASFENIHFENNTFIFTDIKPENQFHYDFATKVEDFVESGINGLKNLLKHYRADDNPSPFFKQLNKRLNTASMRLSKWKITLSVLSLGAIPVILLVATLALYILRTLEFISIKALERAITKKA